MPEKQKIIMPERQKNIKLDTPESRYQFLLKMKKILNSAVEECRKKEKNNVFLTPYTNEDLRKIAFDSERLEKYRSGKRLREEKEAAVHLWEARYKEEYEAKIKPIPFILVQYQLDPSGISNPQADQKNKALLDSICGNKEEFLRDAVKKLVGADPLIFLDKRNAGCNMRQFEQNKNLMMTSLAVDDILKIENIENILGTHFYHDLNDNKLLYNNAVYIVNQAESFGEEMSLVMPDLKREVYDAIVQQAKTSEKTQEESAFIAHAKTNYEEPLFSPPDPDTEIYIMSVASRNHYFGISEAKYETVVHAQEKYNNVPHLNYNIGDFASLPKPDVHPLEDAARALLSTSKGPRAFFTRKTEQFEMMEKAIANMKSAEEAFHSTYQFFSYYDSMKALQESVRSYLDYKKTNLKSDFAKNRYDKAMELAAQVNNVMAYLDYYLTGPDIFKTTNEPIPLNNAAGVLTGQPFTSEDYLARYRDEADRVLDEERRGVLEIKFANSRAGTVYDEKCLGLEDEDLEDEDLEDDPELKDMDNKPEWIILAEDEAEEDAGVRTQLISLVSKKTQDSPYINVLKAAQTAQEHLQEFFHINAEPGRKNVSGIIPDNAKPDQELMAGILKDMKVLLLEQMVAYDYKPGAKESSFISKLRQSREKNPSNYLDKQIADLKLNGITDRLEKCCRPDANENDNRELMQTVYDYAFKNQAQSDFQTWKKEIVKNISNSSNKQKMQLKEGDMRPRSRTVWGTEAGRTEIRRTEAGRTETRRTEAGRIVTGRTNSQVSR